MGFRKPFRATPVTLGAHYQRKARSAARNTALRYLGAAIGIGVVVGAGSVALTDDGPARIVQAVQPFAVSAGLARARAPQPGDTWRGCNEARAAGTAPIYAGEPGYREGMDSDGDGIACEPYRG